MALSRFILPGATSTSASTFVWRAAQPFRFLPLFLLAVLSVGCGSSSEAVHSAESMEGGGHDHSAESMEGGGHDHSAESMEGGGHDHGDTVDLGGLGEPPTVRLVASSEGPGVIALQVEVSGMALVPVDAPRDHRTGEGHIHVTVDGSSVAMIAEEDYLVTGVSGGTHVVAVTLSSNDHRTYVVDEQPIGATASVVVEHGATHAPSQRFNVEVADSRVVGGVPRFEVSVGDQVEILISADSADEVHLHVYDATAKVAPGSPAVLSVTASIPGIFEAELHASGILVFELQVS